MYVLKRAIAMSNEEEIFEKLSSAVIAGDEKAAVKAAEEALKYGMDPVRAITDGLAKGVRIVGDRFERFEVFLPELMLASDAIKAGISVLEPEIKERAREAIRGVVVIGTVKGDIHDIGKILIGTLLATEGFLVHDLGKDVDPKDFVKKAEEVGADIIAMSAMMSVSRPYQKDVIELLNDMNLRDKYKVVVGGAAVTQEYSEEIGADGYGANASVAMKKFKLMMSEEGRS